MINSKQIFTLVTLCLLGLFSQNQVSASWTHWRFGQVLWNYNFEDISCPPVDGTQLAGTHKASGNQLLLTARDGNVIEIAAKDVRTGRVTVLKSNTTACESDCDNFEVQHCFTPPWGDPFYICGPLTYSPDDSAAGTTHTHPTHSHTHPTHSHTHPTSSSDNSPTGVVPSFSFNMINLSDFVQFDEQQSSGDYLIDMDSATGAKLIAKIRHNQLAGMSIQYADGSVKDLEENKNDDCYDSGPCHKFQARTCYKTPSGDCICVCRRSPTPTKKY